MWTEGTMPASVITFSRVLSFPKAAGPSCVLPPRPTVHSVILRPSDTAATEESTCCVRESEEQLSHSTSPRNNHGRGSTATPSYR